jgi:hypothetical protein
VEIMKELYKVANDNDVSCTPYSRLTWFAEPLLTQSSISVTYVAIEQRRNQTARQVIRKSNTYL